MCVLRASILGPSTVSAASLACCSRHTLYLVAALRFTSTLLPKAFSTRPRHANAVPNEEGSRSLVVAFLCATASSRRRPRPRVARPRREGVWALCVVACCGHGNMLACMHAHM
jgi:hypothetical protein